MQAQGAGRVQKCYVRGWPANDTTSSLPCIPVTLLSFPCLWLSLSPRKHILSTCQESRSIYLGSQALAFTFTHFYYCSCWQGWAQPEGRHWDSEGSSLLQPWCLQPMLSLKSPQTSPSSPLAATLLHKLSLLRMWWDTSWLTRNGASCMSRKSWVSWALGVSPTLPVWEAQAGRCSS